MSQEHDGSHELYCEECGAAKTFSEEILESKGCSCPHCGDTPARFSIYGPAAVDDDREVYYTTPWQGDVLHLFDDCKRMLDAPVRTATYATAPDYILCRRCRKRDWLVDDPSRTPDMLPCYPSSHEEENG